MAGWTTLKDTVETSHGAREELCGGFLGTIGDLWPVSRCHHRTVKRLPGKGSRFVGSGRLQHRAQPAGGLLPLRKLTTLILCNCQNLKGLQLLKKPSSTSTRARSVNSQWIILINPPVWQKRRGITTLYNLITQLKPR